jgi:UDP-N-acetylmuramoyl-L-alanyl-D-glutamate--2,6-diaminopimelate ligase
MANVNVPINLREGGASYSGVASDSRLVHPGYLFVAIACDQVTSNIRSALANGAQAVVIEQALLQQLGENAPQANYIPVENARAELARLAVEFFPRQPKVNIAITGTNGKSSVATFVRQLWGALGYRAASFGTLGMEYTEVESSLPDMIVPKLTTPDALSMHALLDHLAESDIQHFVFEASSHGLQQYRSHQVKLMAAGFTNLTQDHLDYHGSMEAYFEAKTRLFSEILPMGKTAVININSPYAKALIYLINSRRQNLITYGLEAEADLVARNIRLHTTHMIVDFEYAGHHWKDIRINMVGGFQIENILCALGLVIGAGEDIDHLIPLLPSLESARGRMELATELPNKAAIFVDYAHTPDALQRALQSLRFHLKEGARLHLVFGCGGDRDVGKRQPMGVIANQLADVVYVTDDNPRFEDPEYIRAQILLGCPKAQEIAHRELAIATAIQNLREHDILLIAGKGHEQGQLIRDQNIPFDDILIVKKYS